MIHSPTRTCSIVLVENVPKSNIDQQLIKSKKNFSVINYDKLDKKNMNQSDSLYKLIKKTFFLNQFLIILSSFSFNCIPSSYEIYRQNVELKKISFHTASFKMFTLPLNSMNFFLKPIQFCMYRKDFFKTNSIISCRPFINKNQYKDYMSSYHLFNNLMTYNNQALTFKKGFFYTCYNLPPNIFYCIYNILLSFISFSDTVFFNTLPSPKFIFSKKRADRSSRPLPNAYKCPIHVYQNLFNFFPETSNFEFKDVFNVQELKRDIQSTHYFYFKIRDIDQCLLQMNMVEQLLSLKNIRYVSNRYSLFNHLFIKSKQKIQSKKGIDFIWPSNEVNIYKSKHKIKSKTPIDFYGLSNKVNIYSKIHMLNELCIDFQLKKNTSLNLQDYCMLKKFLKGQKDLKLIKFEKFLLHFQKLHSITMRKINIKQNILKAKFKRQQKIVIDEILQKKLKLAMLNVKIENLNEEEIKINLNENNFKDELSLSDIKYLVDN